MANLVCLLVTYAGNNGNGGRRPRIDKGRRTWNAVEEDVLLASLKELVSTGWKSDNGFRAGYIYKLEELMRIHFPRSDIRANPHIMSKLTGWKKNYCSLVYILSRSGVGFNLHGDFTVDCEPGQWEQICSVRFLRISIYINSVMWFINIYIFLYVFFPLCVFYSYWKLICFEKEG